MEFSTSLSVYTHSNSVRSRWGSENTHTFISSVLCRGWLSTFLVGYTVSEAHFNFKSLAATVGSDVSEVWILLRY